LLLNISFQPQHFTSASSGFTPLFFFPWFRTENNRKAGSLRLCLQLRPPADSGRRGCYFYFLRFPHASSRFPPAPPFISADGTIILPGFPGCNPRRFQCGLFFL